MSSSGTTTCLLADLRAFHAKWKEEFKEVNGREPTLEEMTGDVDSGLCRVKDEERRLADLDRDAGEEEGGGLKRCRYYMSRKGRYCKFRSSGGEEGFCSRHRDLLLGRRLGESQGDDDGGDEEGGEGGIVTTATEQKNTRRRIMRMKRMANPLSKDNQVPLKIGGEYWPSVFDNVDDRKLHVDFGCAQGGFVRRLSEREWRIKSDGDSGGVGGEWNYLGVEICAKLVERANEVTEIRDRRRERRRISAGNLSPVGVSETDSELEPDSECPTRPTRNLHYIHCNATISLPFLSLPNFTRCSILFSDPHRGKNTKRRIVNEDFAMVLDGAICQRRGEIYIASDYEPIARDFVGIFLSLRYDTVANADANVIANANANVEGKSNADTQKKPKWKRAHSEEYLRDGGPFKDIASTERDEICEEVWKEVWRVVLVRDVSGE